MMYRTVKREVIWPGEP